MSVKLPLFVEPDARGKAGTKAGAKPPTSDAGAQLARVAPSARPLAGRTWLAVIGSPGEDAPAQFACALSSTLGTQARYVLLTAGAPPALAAALQRSGAEVLRCPPVEAEAGLDAELLSACMASVPASALLLVVESELATQLRGVLDVWVGAAPALAADPQLAQLHRAADLRVPANAEAVAQALGQALGTTLARAPG